MSLILYQQIRTVQSTDIEEKADDRVNSIVPGRELNTDHIAARGGTGRAGLLREIPAEIPTALCCLRVDGPVDQLLDDVTQFRRLIGHQNPASTNSASISIR